MQTRARRKCSLTANRISAINIADLKGISQKRKRKLNLLASYNFRVKPVLELYLVFPDENNVHKICANNIIIRKNNRSLNSSILCKRWKVASYIHVQQRMSNIEIFLCAYLTMIVYTVKQLNKLKFVYEKLQMYRIHISYMCVCILFIVQNSSLISKN